MVVYVWCTNYTIQGGLSEAGVPSPLVAPLCFSLAPAAPLVGPILLLLFFSATFASLLRGLFFVLGSL